MGFRLVSGMISSSPPVRINSSHRKFNGYSAIPGEQRREIFFVLEKVRRYGSEEFVCGFFHEFWE